MSACEYTYVWVYVHLCVHLSVCACVCTCRGVVLVCVMYKGVKAKAGNRFQNEVAGVFHAQEGKQQG